MSKGTSQSSDPKPIKDASTVVVLRDRNGAVETFMVCRHKRSGFMGGVHVFPGGKLDRNDSNRAWLDLSHEPIENLALRMDETDQELALGLAIAAIRETFEEAGVLLTTSSKAIDSHSLRMELHRGTQFSVLAERVGLRPNTCALTAYARWVTPEVERSRFDTRFFLAVLPPGQQASHDGTETTSAAWLRPEQALRDMEQGRIMLAPPTVRTLQWLTGFASSSAAIEASASRKPPLVRPEVVSGPQGWFLALPGDPAHTEPERVLPGSTRMVLEDGAWRDVPVEVG